MASSLNKVQIIGNLTRDIELKETKGGDKVCTVDIATNHPVKSESGEWTTAPDYHKVILWGKLAEVAARYLTKGDKVYFEGSLQTRSWEAEDGSKRYATEIKAKEMILLGSRKREEQSENEAYARKSTKHDSLEDVANDLEGKTKPATMPLDDLPF